MQNHGIRCRFASHDIQAGQKIHEQIDQATLSASPTKRATVMWGDRGRYKLAAENELGETAMAPPAIPAGVLYIRSGKHLFAIGAER